MASDERIPLLDGSVVGERVASSRGRRQEGLAGPCRDSARRIPDPTVAAWWSARVAASPSSRPTASGGRPDAQVHRSRHRRAAAGTTRDIATTTAVRQLHWRRRTLTVAVRTRRLTDDGPTTTDTRHTYTSTLHARAAPAPQPRSDPQRTAKPEP